MTSGPYGLLFASFVPFFFDIPVSTRFRVFGVRFSDKSFIYLAGLQVKDCLFYTLLDNLLYFLQLCKIVLLLVLQLLLSSWRRSILPGICGILAGSLYRLNVFGIRKAKVKFKFCLSTHWFLSFLSFWNCNSVVYNYSFILDLLVWCPTLLVCFVLVRLVS